MDKVSIIIPAYYANEKLVAMTRKCIDGLDWKQFYEKAPIVVNDGSPIITSFDYTGYPQNKGYAHAVNRGLKAASGDYLVICNNDIEFIQADWLDHLLKPLKEGYDISSIVTSDQGWETRDEITEDDRFGSLWAMKRKVYETIGGLDEQFGLGTFEDADYYLRAKEAGFKIGKNWAGIVEHKGRATFDMVDPKHEIFETNKAKFLKKWGYLI